MDAKIIVTKLNSHITELVAYLLPNGKKQGSEWVVGSTHGEAGKSLKVCLAGSKTGVWSDFATGESGDALDLWKAVKGIDTRSAMDEAVVWLGYETSPKFYPPRVNRVFKEATKDWVVAQANTPVFKYLMNERGLQQKIIEKFGIGSKDNHIIFPYQFDGRVVQAKYLNLIRKDGKKQMFVAPANTPPCLFGWQTITDSIDEITLTEGEIDAMSLYQMGYPALSVPFGGGTKGKHDWIENEYENLSRFKRINICFDQDKTGQESVKELMTRLGIHRCYVIQLPCKDANEFLVALLSNVVGLKPIDYYFENAIDCAPNELCNAGIYTKQVEQYFYPTENSFTGYNTPWSTLNPHFKFRHNELTVWTGINGHGKSQLLGQISLHFMSQGAKICIASLEMPPKILLGRLASQATGQRRPASEYLNKALAWFSENLWIYENRTEFSTSKLLDIMHFARCRYGVDVFIIDSLMKCGIGEEDYNGQKAFIEALCHFKNLNDCQIHLITHPRKMKDESVAPGKMDIKGAGAISDLADNCFVIWRNKKPNASISNKAFNARLTCYKQRNGDWEGDIDLWFDVASYLFTEKVDSPITQYIRETSVEEEVSTI